MRRPRFFKHTTAHGHEVSVRWMPDGLHVEVDGQRQEWPEDDAYAIEYAYPARDGDNLCPMAGNKGKR